MIDPSRFRVRTAWHEAGHLTAAHLLGVPIGAATIDPTDTEAGCAEIGLPAIDTTTPLTAGPTVARPDDLRRAVETEAVVLLAGNLAERHAPADLTRSYRTADLADRVTERLETANQPASPYIDRTASIDTNPPGDEQRTFALLWWFHGPGRERAAVTHLDHLTAEADWLLSTSIARRALGAIAAELLEHDTVDADRLVELARHAAPAALTADWSR